MSMTKTMEVWTRLSPDAFRHRSGTQIERRGLPSEKPGWYLIPADPSQPKEWFPPTPAGCDDAFIAFTAREAAIDELTQIITRD